MVSTFFNDLSYAMGQEPYVFYRLITPRYFTAMGIPLLAGRFFDQRDSGDSSRVVIVNRTMAHRYWPNPSPLGKRVSFARAARSADWLTVVGVVGDTTQAHDWLAETRAIANRGVSATSPVPGHRDDRYRIAARLRLQPFE
jgi:hypothetical protein